MIQMVDLVSQYNSIKPQIDEAIQNVLSNGKFILGPNEKTFEQEVANYLGVKHAIGVASGTDALIIALKAAGIGQGDEVIVPSFSFFATAGAVMNVGAIPVFVDIEPDTYLINVAQIERVINKKSKAIIPVHLYGQAANMDEINSLAAKYGLMVIEDNAQGFGAEYKGKKTGSLGDLGCLSFFPTKNLGGYGDGGMIVTNNDQLAEKVNMLRVHGWKKKYYPEILGYNSRLDEIQAAILRVKLNYIDQWNDQRRTLAHEFSNYFKKNGIITPVEGPDRTHIYHLYIIRVKNRDEFQKTLLNQGIASEVYYPQPLHFAKPYRDLGLQIGSFPIAEQASLETLALPLYPQMSTEQIDHVKKTVESAYLGKIH